MEKEECRKIGDRLKISQNTVAAVIRRFGRSSSTTNQSCDGRPSDATDNLALRNRPASATDLAQGLLMKI